MSDPARLDRTRWQLYARLGADHRFTGEDVRRLLGCREELGLPRGTEGGDEVTASLLLRRA